jgi:hypothetical protein
LVLKMKLEDGKLISGGKEETRKEERERTLKGR